MLCHLRAAVVNRKIKKQIFVRFVLKNVNLEISTFSHTQPWRQTNASWTKSSFFAFLLCAVHTGRNWNDFASWQKPKRVKNTFYNTGGSDTGRVIIFSDNFATVSKIFPMRFQQGHDFSPQRKNTLTLTLTLMIFYDKFATAPCFWSDSRRGRDFFG